MGCQQSTEKSREIVMTTKRQKVFAESVSMEEVPLSEAMRKDEKQKELLIAALRKNFVFAALEPEELANIVQYLAKDEVYPGQIIIKQGEQGDYFYVVEEGQFEIVIDDKIEGKAGESFGELALLYGAPRAATVRALTEGIIWKVDRATFRSTLAAASAKTKDVIRGSLQRVEILKGLTESQLELVVDAVHTVKFTKGTRIIRKNDKGETFYLIHQGTVGVQNVTLKAGDYFGERALMTDQPRDSDVTALTDVVLYAMDRAAFVNLLGPLKEVLDKNMAMRGESVKTKVPALEKIAFKDLVVKNQLGSGTFGRVKLVDYRKRLFALKTMHKSELVKQRQAHAVIREKELMQMCMHPCILRLYATFQDPHRLHLLLEFLQGGELFSVLHTKQGDGITHSAAQFYAVAVAAALQCIHDNKVAYRDLKPENILLDSQGYPKLVDFGFAKIVKDKTYTLCGTPEYLAPELVVGRGHDFGVDWWAFGILIYEMIVGYTPFVASDPSAICKNVIRAPLRFPRKFADKPLDLCTHLLVRNPSHRLGKSSRHKVLKHPWLASVDLDALLAHKLKPPWQPKIKNATDCSNFENYDINDNIDLSYKDTPALWHGFTS